MVNRGFVFVTMAVWAYSLSAQSSDVNSFDRLNILTTPWHYAIADMDLDGVPDLVGVYGNSGTDIDIFLGTENDTFELATTLDGSSGSEYYGVLLEDLNGDMLPDIIAISNVSGIIFISDEKGDYTEINVASDHVSYDINATSIVDLNGDQKLDLVYNRYVHINDGAGAFTTIDRFIEGNGPIDTFDYNEDGQLDLVVGDPGSGFIRFYLGNGDGTFASSPSPEYEGIVDHIEIHDFDNDGLKDVIFYQFGEEPAFIILYNDENHLFTASDTLFLGHSFYTILAINDVNLDGVPDIVGSNDNDLEYWPLSQSGGIGEKVTFPVASSSIREFHYVNMIGEDFDDLVVVSGFGSSHVFSDKLNATLTQLSTEKVYDNLPISDFFEVSPDVTEVTVSYEGFEGEPADAGDYSINLTINDDVYEGRENLNFQITKRPLSVDVADVTIFEWESIPEFELTYQNFVEGEGTSSLISEPIASSEATDSSPPGEYEIQLSGGEALNYTFELNNGVLIINEALSVDEEMTMKVYPNPAKDKVTIESFNLIDHISIANMDGKFFPMISNQNSFDLQGLQSGIYLIDIHFKNGLRNQVKLIKQ